MVGIARSSVVCFVVDTTGSMSDDIAEAREVINEIIDTKKGTQDEPSQYILVPFNDPGRKSFPSRITSWKIFVVCLATWHSYIESHWFCRIKEWSYMKSVIPKTLLILLYNLYAGYGPLFRTRDAEEMKRKISNIRPSGGGDLPEMCYTGLQVLNHALWYC